LKIKAENKSLMLKILPIKKSKEFKKIGQIGSKFHCKNLILIANQCDNQYFFDKASAKNALNFCRIGITVSSKIGGAVVRNKVKRRLKFASKSIFVKFAKNQQDYIIIAKSSIKDAKYQEILRDLEFCLKKIKYL
jgi:ribonuclease P protein component